MKSSVNHLWLFHSLPQTPQTPRLRSSITSRQSFITSSLLHVKHDLPKLTVNNETKPSAGEKGPSGLGDFRIKASEKSISLSIYPYLLMELRACRSHLFFSFLPFPLLSTTILEEGLFLKRNVYKKKRVEGRNQSGK